MNKKTVDSLVLIGVVNRCKDLEIIFNRHWYRIPVKYAPKRRPGYIAFYQTHIFGKEGKTVQYYARIKSSSVARRTDLLPEEKNHARAKEYYYKFELGKIRSTPCPVRNISRQRISFGFTSLSKLQKSKRICQLFDINPIEDIMRRVLKRKGIRAVHEHCLIENKHCRYRLDFAVFCRHGKIALECDNEKSHSTPACRLKDKKRDHYLSRRGWFVLRLRGKQIKDNINSCLKQIEQTIDKLGGLKKPL
ncbi:MAG: DUF559 domain-containing protein [Candidatus Omnitrophica bacterium]|nr:DUF559 domain-containing protein [Candidatus Omnitrophota bacterium]